MKNIYYLKKMPVIGRDSAVSNGLFNYVPEISSLTNPNFCVKLIVDKKRQRKKGNASTSKTTH